MMREKDDPEKRNLLTEQKEDKKRRQYSGSRTKADRRSLESSSSEHRKRGGPYKTSSMDQRPDYKQTRTQSMPYQSEKKDSWWFWQKEEPNKQPEDTCSCVSCALKRIVSSEYACVGCLLFLFTISIIIAFLVVFKNVPSIGGGGEPECKECKECTETTTTSTPPPKCGKIADSERLKRKIEMLSDNRLKNDLTALDEFGTGDKRAYDDALSGHIDIPGMPGIDFGPSFRELNSLEESENKASKNIDWSNVLETNDDSQSSERLKEFYRKLAQTDAKIKNLKKSSQVMNYIDSEDASEKSPERSKRSLKLYNYPKRYRLIRQRRSTFNKDKNNYNFNKRKSNKNRTRRYNSGEEPTGFVIEKKKLIVQYKPSALRKKIPVKKCSHAPKDTHIHENQLKHPFYKNTQRLDELLDLFLNKNLPDLMTDPFGLDSLFKHDKLSKCKHPTPAKNVNIIGKEQLIDQIPRPRGKAKKIKDEKRLEGQSTSDFMKMLRPESTTQYEKDFYHHEVQMIGNEKQKVFTASPSDFEVLLSVSTIIGKTVTRPDKPIFTRGGLNEAPVTEKMTGDYLTWNPDLKRTGKIPMPTFIKTGPILDKVPNIRRLMQIQGEDDENLGYEDFKEVLTDDLENHDDMDRPADRKKRRDDQDTPSEKYPKYNPPGVHNPNWKGPMPLYPDELNSMIKHAALNSNKIEIPTLPSTNDWQSDFLMRKGRDLSDVEYVEDYLKNKYENLVAMAQAYSDYGVLDGKKESKNEKDPGSDVTATDHRTKLADDKHIRNDFLAMLKEGRVPHMVTETTDSIRRQRDVLQYYKELHISDSATEQTEAFPTTLLAKHSEGIRFELRPTKKPKEDDVNIMKMIQKHFKFKPIKSSAAPKKQSNMYSNNYLHSTLISSYPDMELICSTKANKSETQTSKAFKNQDDPDYGMMFAISKGKRSLLSTDFKHGRHLRNKAVTRYAVSSQKSRAAGSIDRFVQRLNLRKYNSSSSAEDNSALIRYIDKVKQKNIRIYSTAHPYLSNFTSSANFETAPVSFDTSAMKFSTAEINFDTSAESFDTRNLNFDTSNVNFDDSTSRFYNNYTTLNYEEKPSIAPYLDLKPDSSHDTVVTINKSEISDYSGNNFQGKILLTVENPELGVENINLQFDVPLVINFNDELMMMSDNLNFPNIYNQFEIFTDTTVDIMNDTDLESYLGPEYYSHLNKTKAKAKRTKRNATESALNNNATLIPYASKYEATVPVNITTNSSINLNVSVKSNRTPNRSEPDMSLSDFFMMVSDWFKAIEGVKVDKPRDNSGSDLTEMLLKMNRSNESSTEAAYPLYDSDMIENIGHRSRVLLSIENMANLTDGEKTKSHANVTKENANASGGNASNATKLMIHTTINLNASTTNKPVHINTITSETGKKLRAVRKAIFKRNADDSNLIFWNDIYDDEYGIQADKLDNTIRDKHSVKENDFIKRSGRWVHDKIKKFAENLKINPRSEPAAIKERLPRSLKNSGVIPYPKYIYDRIYDRVGRRDQEDREDDDYDADRKSMFTALSANMKNVCQKAAKAVQQTRNIEVREDSKQGSIASTLMQQLVRLLTDLVDYQVQQKTCAKLPPELQSFLEWLTYPKDDTQEALTETVPYKTPYQEEDLIDDLEIQNNDDQDSKFSERTTEHMEFGAAADKSSTVDPKTHYIDCVHAVQDLLDQYDEMNDDEKSKTTGVKTYLENQMKYLNKQLAGYDLYTFLEKRNNLQRYKRDLHTKKHQSTKRRPRRKLHKFIKNFGKKHTRTTAGFEGMQVTDMELKTAKGEDRLSLKSDQTFEDKIPRGVKRNLKDVYYKAIAEAKKYATAKNVHKKDEVTGFESTTENMLKYPTHSAF